MKSLLLTLFGAKDFFYSQSQLMFLKVSKGILSQSFMNQYIDSVDKLIQELVLRLPQVNKGKKVLRYICHLLRAASYWE